jgi:hypothetical protein
MKNQQAMVSNCRKNGLNVKSVLLLKAGQIICILTNCIP